MKGKLLLVFGFLAIVISALLFLTGNDSKVTEEFEQMETSTLTFVTETSNITLEVKIADSPEERAAGFQFISKDIIEKSAILFVYADSAERMFHMNNVAAELDIAFIAENGIIIDMQRMVPGSSLYTSAGPAKFALETGAGYFEQNGIKVGDRISINGT